MKQDYSGYIEEFDDFMSKYKKDLLGPAEIASCSCRFVYYMSLANKKVVMAEIAYNVKHTNILNTQDSLTAKAITSAKADVLASSSEEYQDYKDAKADAENLLQMSSALARLQKGVTAEMGLTQ